MTSHLPKREGTRENMLGEGISKPWCNAPVLQISRLGHTLTIHVDLLAQFYQLHFSRHVSHGSHTVSQVFTADETIFVLIKLLKSIPQLCRENTEKDYSPVI